MDDWSRPFDVGLVGIKGMMVLVKTAGDARVLLDILSDCGYTWPNEVSLRSHSNWNEYEEDTVYFVYDGAEKVIRYGAMGGISRTYYPGYIKCTFSAVPDLVLPEEDTADYALL